MDNCNKMQELKYLREEYGISQSRLAIEAGISRKQLVLLENGKAKPMPETVEKLEKALMILNPNAKLTMVIDYVRIRYETTDVGHVIRELLRLKQEYMIHESFGFYGYEEHYELGNIFVMASQDEEKGVLLELKGQGCRQFEGFLEAQERSWYDFFMESVMEGCVFKRIDLAINDIAGVLDIRELTKKCEEDECISKFRSWRSYRSGELIRRDEKVGMGYTLYIGSLKSDVYFCLYEKDYEQYIKKDIPIESVPVKNRFEIRLMNDRAEHAIKGLLSCWDGEEVAFRIINQYLRFVDKEEGVSREYWENSKMWNWFIGEHREAMKLTSEPQPYSPERTLRWMSRQVAPSWKAFEKVDQNKGTHVMSEMVENATLNERLEKLVEQLSAATEDMII
ncbi:MAG TPA: replication initiation factor domain-containing protein [Candidatus Mediterraneibacter norfolkensis]|nr:replication initiation factor domain-containing protein [Candidatus Mediterraneibacter norfolkensis]